MVLKDCILKVPGLPPLEKFRALLPMVPPKVSLLPVLLFAKVELTTAERKEGDSSALGLP